MAGFPQRLDHYFGDSFKIEFPTGSGEEVSLWDVSQEIAARLVSVFRIDSDSGKR